MKEKSPINPMHAAARCGAHARRTGKPCRAPAMPNGRCRLHGGLSPGAPKGNRNAWKHGLRSADHRAWLLLLRAMRADLASCDG